MKKYLLLCTAFVCSNFVEAQISYSISGGTQFSKWRGNGMALLDTLVENSSDYLKQGSYTGYYIGMGFNIPVGEFIEIEPELRYSKLGSSLSRNVVFTLLKNYGVDVGAKVSTQRLELPVMVKGKIARGLYIVAGPQVNYAYYNRLKLKAGAFGINIVKKSFNVDESFEDFSASAIGGVHYRFPIGVQVQATYEYGLTRIMHITDNVYQNSFKLGMTIPLKYQRREDDEWY